MAQTMLHSFPAEGALTRPISPSPSASVGSAIQRHSSPRSLPSILDRRSRILRRAVARKPAAGIRASPRGLNTIAQLAHKDAVLGQSPVGPLSDTTQEWPALTGTVAMAHQPDQQSRSTYCGLLPSSINGDPIAAALARFCIVAASLPLILCADPASADQASPTAGLVTPYSQAEEGKEIGLLDGRIRPCPTAFNPNCISTSSLNRAYGEPWIIPEASSENAVRKIENAIMSTVKGASILESSDTKTGHYIVAEADGLFGRDTMEFLVREDEGLVLYRSMAGKVLYIYPFTTPITDLDTQGKRMKSLEEELGWAQVAGACDFGVCSEYEDAEEDENISREPRLLPFNF